MDPVTILIAVGWIATIAGFLVYVNERDKREQKLLDRIQAPEVAAANAFVDGPKSKASYAGEVDSNGARTLEEETA